MLFMLSCAVVLARIGGIGKAGVHRSSTSEIEGFQAEKEWRSCKTSNTTCLYVRGCLMSRPASQPDERVQKKHRYRQICPGAQTNGKIDAEGGGEADGGWLGCGVRQSGVPCWLMRR